MAISFACLWLLARRADPGRFFGAVREVQLVPLAASVLTKAIAFCWLAARSRVLLASFGRWPFATFVRGHLLGFGGNVLLPLRFGELLRARFLARECSQPLSVCLGSVVVERALDLLWVALLALFFLPLAVLDGSRRWTVVAVAVTAAGGILIAPAAARVAGRLPRRGSLLERMGLGAVVTRVLSAGESFADGLATAGSVRRFALASLCTLGYWASGIGGVVLWFVAFDLDLRWSAAPVVVVATSLGVALPAAPGFVGTYHVAVVGALRLLGVPVDRAVAVAVVGHFVATVPAGVAALPIVARELRMRGPRAASGEVSSA